jgi:hypothetical protein
MDETLTTVAVFGAAHGAASKFTEMALDSGKKWLDSYYLNNEKQAIIKAWENYQIFLNNLAKKVEALELESEITKALVQDTQSDPSFAALFKKATIAASQTANSEKQEILSTIVSQRLKSAAESLYAVTSQMAVDAISHCTPNQLRILGFAVSISQITPALPCNATTEEQYRAVCAQWINHRFLPYADVHVGPMDYAHLEAVSCLTHLSFMSSDLNTILANMWSRGPFTINSDFVYGLPTGTAIRRLWEQEGVKAVKLTTVGTLIGTIASDAQCGAAPTNFAQWQTET